MADISDLERQQALIRAELDRMKPEIWEILQGRGEEWTERLDQMLRDFAAHDEDPWRIMGKLAQLGFLHLLESHVG
jgi:hypothetical protein